MTHPRRKAIVLMTLDNVRQGRLYVFDDAAAQEIAERCVAEMDRLGNTSHAGLSTHIDALEDTLRKHLAPYKVKRRRKRMSTRRVKARGKLGRLISGIEMMEYRLRGPWYDHRINMDAAYMTPYNMNRFLHMRRESTLEDDVTWRGYDIVAEVIKNEEKYVPRALKALGLHYAGEHGVSQFAKLYEVPAYMASTLLAYWWVWSRLASGQRLRGVKMRAVGGQEGSAARGVAP